MNSRDTVVRRCLRPRILLGVLLAGCAGRIGLIYADENEAKPDTVQEAPAVPNTAAEVQTNNRFEVHSSDGSILRLRLIGASIPLKTEFGTLVIPVADIRRIDFANRVTGEVTERVKSAVKNLGHDEYQTREAASAELLALDSVAYPAILEALKNDDPEVVRRAEVLVEKIKKSAPAEDLQIRDYDLISTDKSQIAGTIELTSLEVDSAVFGRQQVALVMLRRLLSPSDVEETIADVLPDPGDLQNFQGQVGKTLHFRVTGPQQGLQNGAVWGTDLYTFDSNLGMAAVHAGALAAGQTKVVAVTVMGPQNQFVGSARNGITTGSWGPFPAAFTVKSAKDGRPAAGARRR